ETSPAAFARRTVSGFALTSSLSLAKLEFCSTCEEDSSGTSRVGPEAGAPEHQAPGTQQAEPFPAQDPGEEAPRRHRRGRRQDGEVAPVGHGGPDRQGREEGRDPRQRRRAVQEPADAQGQLARRGEVAGPAALPRPPQHATTALDSATAVSAPSLTARSVS